MQRTAEMARGTTLEPGVGTAAELVPDRLSLPALVHAAAACRACPLWRDATQTVFGEGPRTAKALLVGEQPGNDEDIAGRPFVGPAGRLLDRALAEAGIDRSQTYVTNVVKHFKWEPRGKRRIHAKPNAQEIRACLPWLEAEVTAVRPRVIVCLGATAAQSVIGREFRVTQRRGEVVPSLLSTPAVATMHPSSILRAPDHETRGGERRRLVDDLRSAARLIED
jgi:uracil-DNA glycosylase family protein